MGVLSANCLCAVRSTRENPRNRSSLGMQGAGALTRIHVTAGDKLELAACDQSNAFTRIEVTAWMIPYPSVGLTWYLHATNGCRWDVVILFTFY